MLVPKASRRKIFLTFTVNSRKYLHKRYIILLTDRHSYSIPLSRLLARLESSLGNEEKLNTLNEVELRKAVAVFHSQIRN